MKSMSSADHDVDRDADRVAVGVVEGRSRRRSLLCTMQRRKSAEPTNSATNRVVGW
jgi:hypothetical protein